MTDEMTGVTIKHRVIDDPLTGIRMEIKPGVELWRICIHVGSGMREFYFAPDGKFDGTGFAPAEPIEIPQHILTEMGFNGAPYMNKQ